MRRILGHSFGKVAGLGTLTAFLLMYAVSAKAQCGGSFESIMSAIAATKSQSKLTKQPDSILIPQRQLASDKSINTSIVGLWRIKFIIDTPDGPAVFQEAYQIWNAGGTEVHNPKVDPRTGSVCLGSWVQQAPLTFQLTHRVWLYNELGQFQVIGRLTETLTLGDRGNTHSGTFTLQAVDDDENPLGDPLTGTVVGERISPN
jgi:hypothetical protein